MSSSGGGGGGAASASASFEQRAKRRPPGPSQQQQHRKLLRLSVQDDDVAAGVVPPVTVVLDGRCICHRVHLNRHTGYRSLAGALRRLFVDADDDLGEDGLDLANAIPGHVVAYEDMEDDLLLAGDLKWNDFVRVAKRIRIIPAKKSSRTKKCGGGDRLDN
ncbi:auxin-responsive protein IAA33-like [Panicum miliaceum]|uniref:Auxin-responsive protein n=1 Tax=Panicum miliaceum TaxID=4540 RepID=A0A3L6QCA7_PANMI|nr:auxin-responsive protein IAA33-like [Panicum miliaceum]